MDQTRLDEIKERLAVYDGGEPERDVLADLCSYAPNDIRWLIAELEKAQADHAYVCEQLRLTSIELSMWIEGDKTHD